MLIQVLDEVAWSTGVVFLPSIFTQTPQLALSVCVMVVKQIKICYFGGEIHQSSVIDHSLSKAV